MPELLSPLSPTTLLAAAQAPEASHPPPSDAGPPARGRPARRPLAGVALGVCGAAAGLAASWGLRPLTGHSLLFVLLCTVGALTWAGGRAAGVAATLTAVAGAALLLHTDPWRAGWTSAEVITLVAFAGAGTLLTWLVTSLHDARQAAAALAERHAAQADLLRARLVEVEALGVELRAANAALERARAEAERASRAKGDFLSLMSHELRTPLNAIGGYAELMELEIVGPVTPEQRTYLGRVRRSQRYLLGLINSVLNLAKLEAGAVTYAAAPVPVAGVLEAAAELVLPQCTLKGLAFECAAPAGAVCARGDREKIEQVLVNLLGNAVKFTPAGGAVALGCAVDGAAVCLTVRDTGPGIPAEQLEAIFEPFVQAETTIGPRPVGTGLGLAISRGLARGMGGDLTVESTPGAGATFTFRLPRTAPG